tara:strand:- start:2436 stop:2936 length:501 start_codon:yes stop_codon:yes gene_type:complete
MPNARKIIFSSYFIPTKSLEMEETSIRKTSFKNSPSKPIGAKGVVTINATQWGDGWTSMFHPKSTWDDIGDNWETVGKCWDGLLTVDTNATQLCSDTNDLAFLYIQNYGSADCTVSLNGSGGTYGINIPNKGSVALRGDGTTLDCNDVYVKTASSRCSIEYIIAKE